MMKIAIEWRAELKSILRAIQPFAAWHIIPLEKLVNRYFAILKAVNDLNRCGRRCTTLNRTSSFLAEFIAACKDSGNAWTYNSASFELSGDVRDLLRVLKVCAST